MKKSVSGMANICVHHWLTDSCNVGRCCKCDQVKDFYSLVKNELQKKTREPARRGDEKMGYKNPILRIREKLKMMTGVTLDVDGLATA